MAALLEKLRVGELTKSPLAESENGSVIRKPFGYGHIAEPQAERLDREVLARYLNYRRPCLFPRVETDAKGKQRKAYRQADIWTPYEALRALSATERYLRPGMMLAALDQEAHARTDHEAARELQAAREVLFAELEAAA